jgi:hypothetical protein
MKRGDTALAVEVEGVDGITVNAVADDAKSTGASRLSFIVNCYIVVKKFEFVTESANGIYILIANCTML